jgi:hypothetical protein
VVATVEGTTAFNDAVEPLYIIRLQRNRQAEGCKTAVFAGDFEVLERDDFPIGQATTPMPA